MAQKFLILSLLLALLSACGATHNPIGEPINFQGGSADLITGHSKIQKPEDILEDAPAQLPYTLAGNQRAYTELKNHLTQNNPLLARSIKSVQMTRSDDLKEVTFFLQFNSYFGLTALTFRGPFSNLLLVQKQPEDFSSNFDLRATCLDDACQLIQLILQEKTKNQGPIYDVGVLYQQKKARHATQGQSSEALKASGLQTIQSSVVVVDGPSYSRVEIIDPLKEANPLLVVDTELVETSEGPTKIRSATGSLVEGAAKIQGSLVGNDPETGSVIIDLSLQPEEPPLRLIIESQEVAADPRPTDPHASLWDRYLHHPEVRKRVELWQKGGSACTNCSSLGPQIASRFLANAKAFRSVIAEVAAATGVSVDNKYLMALESKFFVHEDFPVEITKYRPDICGRCTASGPWQLTEAAAKDVIKNYHLPFQVLPIQGSGDQRHLHPQDDRGYFVESTQMAFLHLKGLNQMFTNDIGLSLLAYHLGQGATSRALDQLIRRHGGVAETKLDDLIRFNMIRNAKQKGDYVYSALALRNIGQDPDQYGFQLADVVDIPAEAMARLRNPHRNR